MLSSARSPSTMIVSATRLPNASSVARSVSVYARRSSARPSVAPMPWPDSMYQGAAGTTPAAFQRASSSAWVPDLSPRDTNRAPAAAILPSAATALVAPANVAGSAAGPTSPHGARAATSRRASLTPIRAQCSARAILCGTPHISRDQEDTVMAQERKGVVTLKGTPLTLVGPEIKPGQRAPDFTAVDTSLQAVRLSDAKGKVLIVSSVPSLDPPVCDTETRRFNQEPGQLGTAVEVWTNGMDLPFAQKRWCGAAGVNSVKTLSDFRERAFAQSYGVEIKDGPLAGLTARAVFVVGRDG